MNKKEDKESEEKYRLLVNSLDDGIQLCQLIWDDDGRPVDNIILEVNPGYEIQTGLARAQVEGKRISEIIPDFEPEWLQRYAELVRTGQSIRFEEYNCSTERWYNVYAYPMPKDNQFGVVFRDITKNKLYEKELIHRDELEALVEQKTEQVLRLERFNLIGEMAAGLGHEIRNPMTTVRGYLQMFQRQEKFAEYTGQIQTMIEELDRANSIISEFLSLAKDKRVVKKPTCLNTVIQKFVLLIQTEAIHDSKRVETELGDIPKIIVDEDEIRQCILNLTRNALDATPKGGVVTIYTDWDGENTVLLSVRDNGSGIPHKVLSNLGTPFVTTKETGTGLGLPTCYRIAERHNAKIEVDSNSAGTNITMKFLVN